MNQKSDNQSDERALVQAGYRFALALTQHAEEAEDIVQQSCFRVIAKKGRLHSRAYLFQAIRNLYAAELTANREPGFSSL